MGNFQELAEKVLAKNNYNSEKVSSFLALAKETGNFSRKNGNCQRNLNKNISNENQYSIGETVETNMETNRKPALIPEETFALKNIPISFVVNSKSSGIIEQFFSIASTLGIELLPEDKRWIKIVCFGISTSILDVLIIKYVECWHNAMNLEPLSHKKQNIGRNAANSWLHEVLLGAQTKERSNDN